MSLQSRIGDLITAIGTDMKQLRTWITGSSSGTLSGLTTTDKTSIVNAINEVKAGSAGSPPDATTTVKGIVELATDTETTTGTDTVRAITPSNLAASWTARISTSTSLGTSDTLVPSQNAAKTYIDGIIDAANAMQYKGVIDASANPNYPAASSGWNYMISVAGKIGGASGPNVEVGDLLVCLADGTAAGNQATVGANWDIVQKNIDGAVTGPASSTSGNIATYSGTSGKVVQDSAVSISTDGTMASNVDTKVPTEKAIVTYTNATFYTQTQLGNYDTDLAAAYATAKA